MSIWMRKALLALLTLAVAAGGTSAHTYYWNAGTADWEVSGNWTSTTGTTYPVAGDSAYVNNGGTLQATSTTVGCHDLLPGHSGGSTGNIELTNSNLTTTHWLIIGWSGTGQVTQTGGTVTSSGYLNLAQEFGSHGDYTLDGGGTLIVNNNLAIAVRGYGKFTQKDGTVTVLGGGSPVVLGQVGGGDPTNVGIYEIQDGSLTVTTGSVIVGQGAAGSGTDFGGTIAQTGGSVDIQTGSLTLGHRYSTTSYHGSGAYNLSGPAASTLTVNGNINVGYYGVGEFNQTGGVAQTNSHLSVAALAGSQGTCNLTGGTMNVAGNVVNGLGTAVLNLDGGTLNVSGTSIAADTLRIGNAAGTNGIFSPAATHTVTVANNLELGVGAGATGTLDLGDATVNVGGNVTTGAGTGNLYCDGTGTLNVTGGVIGVTNFEVGHATGSTGAYTHSTGTLNATATVIGTAGTGVLTHDGGTLNATNGLILGKTSSGHGTCDLSGSAIFNAGGPVTIGDDGKGFINQTGGAVKLSGGSGSFLILGQDANAEGTWTLTGGSVVSNLFPLLGEYGKGTIDQSGGTTFTANSDVHVGWKAGGTGLWKVSGAGTLLDAKNYLIVGNYGEGTLEQTDGTVKSGNELRVGQASGTGIYNLSGAGSKVELSRSLVVGMGLSGTAAGTFNHNGGTVEIPPGYHLSMGTTASGTGTYNLSGGTLNIGGNVIDGPGSSTLNLDGGTLVVGGGSVTVDTLNIANAPGTTITYTPPPGLTLNCTTLGLAVNGTDATLDLAAGAANVSGNVTTGAGVGRIYVDGGSLSVAGNTTADFFEVGHAAGATGTHTHSTGSLNATVAVIGNEGTGTLTHNGGTLNTASGFILGKTASGHGTCDLSGSAILNAGGPVTIGDYGKGFINQSGGTAAIAGGGYLILGQNTNAEGTWTITGGSVVSNLHALLGKHGKGTIDQSGGSTFTANSDVHVGWEDGSVGEWKLSGANTRLDARGYLIVGNKGTATGTFRQAGGTVTVGTDLRLGAGTGDGTYVISGGSLDVDELIRNGMSGTGRFHIIGDDATIEADGYTQNALSTLELDINGISPINVDGAVTLAGGLDVEFLFPPDPCQWFPIIVNDGTDSVVGMFAGLDEGAMFRVPGSGPAVRITYAGNFDGGSVGNDVGLFTIPEPATLTLLGFGAIGLLARRRRR